MEALIRKITKSLSSSNMIKYLNGSVGIMVLLIAVLTRTHIGVTRAPEAALATFSANLSEGLSIS